MTTPTFTPPRDPSPPSNWVSTPRVKEASFGDNYSQRSREGINSITRTATLVWEALTPDEADVIDAFFDAKAGTDAFYYTMPLTDTPLKFTNGPVRRSYPSPIHVTVSVDIKQVFDLGA